MPFADRFFLPPPKRGAWWNPQLCDDIQPYFGCPYPSPPLSGSTSPPSPHPSSTRTRPSRRPLVGRGFPCGSPAAPSRALPAPPWLFAALGGPWAPLGSPAALSVPLGLLRTTQPPSLPNGPSPANPPPRNRPSRIGTLKTKNPRGCREGAEGADSGVPFSQLLVQKGLEAFFHGPFSAGIGTSRLESAPLGCQGCRFPRLSPHHRGCLPLIPSPGHRVRVRPKPPPGYRSPPAPRGFSRLGSLDLHQRNGEGPPPSLPGSLPGGSDSSANKTQKS